MSKDGSSQNLVDCHSVEKDLVKQLAFASQGLSFLRYMDTAVFQAQLTRMHYLSISHEHT